MIDVRTIEGQIVKLNAHDANESGNKILDVVPSMYKMNVEDFKDLNQLLTYHEVFGKLQPPNPSDLSNNGDQSQQHSPTIAILHNTSGMVVKSCDPLATDTAAGTVLNTDMNMANNSNSASPAPVIVPTGTHTCDICGKIFPFRYQMIVHRRYHAEKKPFTCQVTNSIYLQNYY